MLLVEGTISGGLCFFYILLCIAVFILTSEAICNKQLWL